MNYTIQLNISHVPTKSPMKAPLSLKKFYVYHNDMYVRYLQHANFVIDLAFEKIVLEV